MIKYRILILFSLSMIFASCEKEEVFTYNREADGVFFVNDTSDITPEFILPIEYSFMNNPTLEFDTVYIYTRVSGNTADYDRMFNVELVDGDITTGTADQYEILEGVVPAGSHIGTLPIVINKTEELKDDAYSLELKLVASEDFKNTDNHLFNAYLNYTALIAKPDLWDIYLYYWFGDFSRNYYGFIIEQLGTTEIAQYLYEEDYGWLYYEDTGWYTFDEWMGYYPDPVMNGYKNFIKIALEEYEATNGEPLKHNDGSVVVLPD